MTKKPNDQKPDPRYLAAVELRLASESPESPEKMEKNLAKLAEQISEVCRSNGWNVDGGAQLFHREDITAEPALAPMPQIMH